MPAIFTIVVGLAENISKITMILTFSLMRWHKSPNTAP